MITTQPLMIFSENVPARLQLTLQNLSGNVHSDLSDLESQVSKAEAATARRASEPVQNVSPGQAGEWAVGEKAETAGLMFFHDGSQWARLGLWGVAANSLRLSLDALEDETAAINLALMNLPQRPTKAWGVVGYEIQYWVYGAYNGSWFQFASLAARIAWASDDETGIKAIRYVAYDFTVPIYGWIDL